jgi:hypothetical protein
LRFPFDGAEDCARIRNGNGEKPPKIQGRPIGRRSIRSGGAHRTAGWEAAPPLRMNAVKTDESRQIDLKEAESCYLHGQKGAEGWFGGESDERRKTSARSLAHMA